MTLQYSDLASLRRENATITVAIGIEHQTMSSCLRDPAGFRVDILRDVLQLENPNSELIVHPHC